MIRRFLADVRQLRFPPEFRIAAFREEAVSLEGVEALISALPTSAEVTVPQGDGREDAGDESLARVATGLWRLRRRMLDAAGGNEPGEGIRRAYRHFEFAWDALSDHGVEIRDHTGEVFDSGSALAVLSFEPDQSLTREMVKETVKPTIYLRERCLQRGEVIVGTPRRDGGDGP